MGRELMVGDPRLEKRAFYAFYGSSACFKGNTDKDTYLMI